MLATFLLAVPMIPPALAQPAPCTLTGVNTACLFVPADPSADLGQSFTTNVMVFGTLGLIGADFRVLFDPNILQVTGTGTLTGTVFDPALHSVLVAKQECFNTIGVCRLAVVFQGGFSAAVFPTAAPIWTLTFKVNNPLMGTAKELPSKIVTGSSTLVGLDARGATVLIPHNDDPAFYTPINVVGVRSVGCKADIQGFNIIAHGFTDTIFCRVTNNGAGTVIGGASFSWHSLNGIVGSSSSATSTLAAGQAGEYDSSITLPSGVSSNDIFIMTGTLLTSIPFPDGTSYGPLGGPPQGFIIIVNG